jgi:hypothetical protein
MSAPHNNIFLRRQLFSQPGGPMGQHTHQGRGLKNSIAAIPKTVELSITPYTVSRSGDPEKMSYAKFAPSFSENIITMD